MTHSSGPIELWGGVEYTINRVGDVYYDQGSLSRHAERIRDDLELFAGLGVRTLRTGILWEQVDQAQWRHADETLGCMQELGLNAVVGLLHHGSGPASTDLLDAEFPQKFAAFALQVARRYPSVVDYTPINEPQTTGRFACLYGHWFPHHRSMHSYVRALFNQVKAIVLAMEAIRSVQPHARLIHTEDGGRTYASEPLESYRVEREHRRWLGLDLLCGRVVREHPLCNFLLQHGLDEREVMWFAEHPCPPAIVGMNYYVTSDRFLDHRLHLYPEYLAGGDTGCEPLVDFEAVRVRREGIAGVRQVLCEAWERYRLPVAITEAHLGCEPDEQVLWLEEIWRDAQRARAEGADVRAVTAWGLLGLHNWSNLCTRDIGSYEPGVFDISSGTRRPTPLADLMRGLAKGDADQNFEMRSLGWWQRSSRLTVPPPSDGVDPHMILTAAMNGSLIVA